MRFIIRYTILAILFAFPFTHATAQKHPLTIKIISLINEARKDPATFLEQHSTAIEEENPRFAKLLAVSKPIAALEWDPALEAQCRAKLDGNLDPPYTGKRSDCGAASGMQGSWEAFEPMEVVAGFYTNVLDPNCKYFGIAFDKADKTYWFSWGYLCERVKAQYTFTGKVDSSKVDFNRLNTARTATYLSDLEKRMVLEINFVRAYPKVYAKIIAQDLHNKANGTWGLDHDDYMAGIELIAELEEMEPVAILTPKQCVYNAAKRHGLDCSARGYLDHTGSDGSSPWDRIGKACTDIGTGNENLQGGGESNPRYAVISLLVDGGISNRGHRYNMLDADWRYVGCYLITGKAMKIGTTYNWVQNFASEKSE